jgi:hypothetical protein
MIHTSVLACPARPGGHCLHLKDTILVLRPFVALAFLAALVGALVSAPASAPAQSADAVYPKGSRIGLSLSPGSN